MDNDKIEDVERGADQSFFVANSGRTDRNVDQILGSDRTDRLTDRQTNRRNKHMVSLPCF